MELEPETIAIAFVGRIVVWKGVDVFIEAAKLLKASAPSVKFVVIGGGEAEFLKTLQESVVQYDLQGDFLWMGPRQDIELLLNGIDVLTVCSKRGEGFPNIIGEALASGTVVVATDVGDNRSIVRNDQLIVPSDDPTTISAVWQFLLDNPEDHSKFGRDGITLSSKLYSVEHMVNQTDRMLTDLVSLHDER
jgi:glycosyltransferase involved in cell wall biosynthesis